MSITNIRGGLFVDGVPVIGGGGYPPSIGSYFYVDSVTGNNSNDGTKESPLATITAALALCTASNGDVIVLFPTHAETIATAGGITVSKIGVTILGLGRGSNRPTLTFSAVGSTLAVTAASVTISNIRVTSSVDEMVKMFHVTAAHCTLDRIEHFETTSAQTIQFLLTSNAADYLTVQNCYFSQATAATAAQLWIQLVGCDNVRILNNQFFLVLQNGATCACITATTAVAFCEIAHNIIHQTGGTTQVSPILMVANSTGYAHDNRVASAVTTLAGSVALANLYATENYAVNVVNKNGILEPVVA
jgi:hypothetical protein